MRRQGTPASDLGRDWGYEKAGLLLVDIRESIHPGI